MRKPRLTLSLQDSAATDQLGVQLAQTMPLVELSSVVFLHGELGTGKSSLVRAMLRALGVQHRVGSPTYTLVEAHDAGALQILHIDLYRTRTLVEVEELDLCEPPDTPTLLLCEWAEKGGDALPCPDLDITLSYQALARQCGFEASSDFGARWLQQFGNRVFCSGAVFPEAHS